MTLTQSAAQALGTGTQVSYTLEGCRNNGDITLPNGAGDFICPDAAYTTGNLGKGWNELDLVPVRFTLDSGNANPGTFAFTLVVDNEDAGKPGYDVLSEPVLNDDLSDADCGTAIAGPEEIESPGLGGTDESRYRLITVSGMGSNQVCVYDAYARLALGSHLYPGSSLHFNLANDTLGTAGIGSKEVSIPVKEILPQELDKDMSAVQDSDFIWDVTKSPTPATVDIANTCTGATSFSQGASVTVSWTKLPAAQGGPITVITHVYATNPASRVITIQGQDAIRSGTDVLDTVGFGPIDVPADTANFEVLSHMFEVPAGTTNLNDIATASYIDKVTNVPVPGQTEATASATVQSSGVATNDTATITDVESITGAGLSFSVDSTSGASGTFAGGYVLGTPTTGPVSWTSSEQSGNGSVTFNKTIYSTSANVVTGSLDDTATLNASDGFSDSAMASIGISTNATTSLRVSKTTTLDLANAQTFNFNLFESPNTDTGQDASVTIPALSNGPVVSAYIDGLKANGTYFFKEDANAPYPAQTTGSVTFALVPGNPDSCKATINVLNNAGPATARVKKDTLPASNGNWTMTLTGPNGLSETLTNVQAGGGYFPFASELDVDGGLYTITETPQAGYDLTTVAGDFNGDSSRVTTSVPSRSCSFTLNLATDSNGVFSCAFVNTQRGHIIIEKQTIPDGATQEFEFDVSYGANFFLKDGEQNDSGLLEPGEYSAAEVNIPNGWDLTSMVCSDGSPVSKIVLDPGETVTCVFTNTKRGHVTVIKTENGGNPTHAYSFRLTGGPDNVDITKTTDPAPGSGGETLDFGLLKPGNYTLCELAVPAGTHSTLEDQGGVLDPNTGDICLQFTLAAGEEKSFTIDNSMPGGGQRTIGYWKNWASCNPSGGDWAAKALKSGNHLMDEFLPQSLGNFVVDTCAEGRAVLSDPGAKYAENQLAAQLFAAKLNVAAQASTCQQVTNAISAADALLVQVGYAGPPSKIITNKKQDAAARASALALASLLDDYNNGLVC